MAEKPKRERDDPEQSKRFIATAKEAEADDEGALDRAFKKVVSSKPKVGRSHPSD